MQDATTFAAAAFAWTRTLDAFEEKLLAFGIDFDGIDWDEYDHSLVIKEVPNATRLNLEAQEFLFQQGFSMIYVCHCDGWQTHYQQPATLKPWRRKILPGGSIQLNFVPKAWVGYAECAIKRGKWTVIPDA